jgi:hypothetical protein
MGWHIFGETSDFLKWDDLFLISFNVSNLGSSIHAEIKPNKYPMSDFITQYLISSHNFCWLMLKFSYFFLVAVTVVDNHEGKCGKNVLNLMYFYSNGNMSNIQ